MPVPVTRYRSLGQIVAIDRNLHAAAARWMQRLPPIGMAVTAKTKEHVLIHQRRLVERHDAVAIGDERRPALRQQLDQRDAAASFRVDDLNREDTRPPTVVRRRRK